MNIESQCFVSYLKGVVMRIIIDLLRLYNIWHCLPFYQPQMATFTLYRINEAPVSPPLVAGKKISEGSPKKDQNLVISFGEIPRNQVQNLLFTQR